MRLGAMLSALGEGQRVRNLSWSKDEYIFVGDNEIRDEKNKTFYIDFNDCDEDWEIFE